MIRFSPTHSPVQHSPRLIVTSLLGLMLLVGSPLALAGDAGDSGADSIERELPFAVVSFPDQIFTGTTVPLVITLNEDLLDDSAQLAVDLHGFRGTERVAGLWHSRKIPIAAGVTDPQTFEVPIPEGKDIQRVSFVIFLLPEGVSDFKQKIHAAETTTDVFDQ